MTANWQPGIYLDSIGAQTTLIKGIGASAISDITTTIFKETYLFTFLYYGTSKLIIPMVR